MFAEITGANKKYTMKRYKHAHSVHNSKVLRTCLAHGNIFKNVGFPKETRQILLFIKKYAMTSKSSYIQIVLKSTMYLCMYLYKHTYKQIQQTYCYVEVCTDINPSDLNTDL